MCGLFLFVMWWFLLVARCVLFAVWCLLRVGCVCYWCVVVLLLFVWRVACLCCLSLVACYCVNLFLVVWCCSVDVVCCLGSLVVDRCCFRLFAVLVFACCCACVYW